jgi:hypothetical protein
MSEINFAYEKLMQEHNLSISDLPEDAKIGITTLKDIEKSIKMAEKKGNVVSEKTYAKIKANDKWVVKEILDFVDETDDNEDNMPYNVEEIEEEIEEYIELDDDNEEEEEEEQIVPQPQNSALGQTIEKELTDMFNSGRKEWASNQIKGGFKNTYNTLFENYDDNGENGIETSNYRLIESGNELFTISKK